MLGVAFIHLLADANASMVAVTESYPALAMTVATIGVLLVLTVEQIVIYLLSCPVASKNALTVVVGQHSAPQQQHHVAECELSKPAVAGAGSADCSCEPLAGAEERVKEDEESCTISAVATSDHSWAAPSLFDHGHDGHEHGHAHDEMGHNHGHGHEDGHENCCSDHDSHSHHHSHHAQARLHLTSGGGGGGSGGGGVGDLSLLVKALIMEIAIALHSVIIGVAFGSMGTASKSELVGLLVALSFHQLFEGIALGTALQAARTQLGSRKVFGFALTFALTTPIGITIGLLAMPPSSADDPSDGQIYAQGILNSIAAGNLVYIALVEMVSADFNSPLATKNVRLRTAMLTALCAGDLVMAILAVWA